MSEGDESKMMANDKAEQLSQQEQPEQEQPQQEHSKQEQPQQEQPQQEQTEQEHPQQVPGQRDQEEPQKLQLQEDPEELYKQYLNLPHAHAQDSSRPLLYPESSRWGDRPRSPIGGSPEFLLEYHNTVDGAEIFQSLNFEFGGLENCEFSLKHNDPMGDYREYLHIFDEDSSEGLHEVSMEEVLAQAVPRSRNGNQWPGSEELAQGANAREPEEETLVDVMQPIPKAAED